MEVPENVQLARTRLSPLRNAISLGRALSRGRRPIADKEDLSMKPC